MNAERAVNTWQVAYGKDQCYYLPKELLTNKEFACFSTSSKLLAGIIFSCAENGQAVMETAKLIEKLGKSKINRILKNLGEEKGKQNAI